jgi:hypothetical protein
MDAVTLNKGEIMNTKLLQIGQKVYCSLYGGKYGYITKIIGEQSPESCRSIAGVAVTGGKADLEICFEDHFSQVPESLVRNSVQWKVYSTVISASDLEAKKSKAQSRIDAEKAKAEQEALEKALEEERQRAAAEYAHLTPCDKYNMVSTAQNIRTHIKHLIKTGVLPNVKFSVRKEHYNCIYVRWTDGPTKKEVEELIENFSDYAGTRLDDCVEYKQHAWIFGTVTYLRCEREISDELLQETIDKINKRYNHSATVDDYKQGRLPPLTENADWNSYSREIWAILANEIDYELEDKRWERGKEVKAVLKEQFGFEDGYKKPDCKTTVSFFDGEWLIDAAYSHQERIVDDCERSSQFIALLINEAYGRVETIYKAEQKEYEEREAIRNQEIIPIQVNYDSKFIDVTFPALNKNDSLAENDECILEDGTLTKCEIKKSIILTDEQFKLVGDSLMNDRPELWEKIGGAICDDEYLEGLKKDSDDYYEAWRVHGIRLVVEVLDESMTDSFYVDTSGYGYARYCGRSDFWLAGLKAKNIINKISSNLVH